MDHELTIASLPGAGTEPGDEPFHVMAHTNLGAFEDQDFPDVVQGTLQMVPEHLVEYLRNDAVIRVELGGQTYRLAVLDAGGAFELRKDERAQVLPTQSAA